MPAHGIGPHAQAGGDGYHGRAVQRSVRSRRRNRHGSAVGPMARLRRAASDRHVAGGDRGDLADGDPAPGRVWKRRARQGPAGRASGGGRGADRHHDPAARAYGDDRAAVRAADDRGCGRPRGQMIVAVLMGLAAGVLSGLLGVGGGILFVPALTLVLGLSQIRAEATSLLAIIPVALVGAWRQQRYGNVDLRDGAVLGALSAVGVGAGVALANVLPQKALRFGFAAVILVVAAQFIRRWHVTRTARLHSGE